MKKFITIAALLLVAAASKAQTRATVDAQGNYIAVSSTQQTAKPTGHTIKAPDGKVYPVFTSIHGKLFYNRISKAGKPYRCYIKTN